MRANPRVARITAGCLGLSLVVAAVAGAQCTNPVQISNQTISSGSPSFTDANALRADAVVVQGSASVTFIAGNCINLKPGFRATAGTAGTTFHAWVQTVPAAVSVTPASGSGLSQTFTWTASSPAGYGSLAEIYARFGTSAYEGPNTCYIRYDRTSNLLYLADNGASAWMGGFAPGSAQSVENSQCKIYGSGASASGSGPQLAVTIPVEFKAAFAGAKNNYMFVRDNIGQYSPWQQMGTWTVAGETPQYTLSSLIVPVGPPAGGSTTLNPAGGSYPSGTQVQVSATPASGYTFTGWSGDLSGTANPSYLTMSANKTVTANFVQTPSQSPPYVSMDYPVSGMSVSGLVLVQGWAMDNLTNIETAINRVEVYVDGAFVGTATSGIRRDDKCSLYPNRPGCPIVGFRYAWNTLSHSNATHTIRLVAFDSDNPQKSSTIERSVIVYNAPPETPVLRIASPGLVEMNLAAVPFDRYTYTDQGANDAPNCPSGVSVRTCYQAALWNYRAQGVTGVRVMFAFCGAGSTALSSCTSGPQGVTVREEWKQRVNDFLADVRDSGIQRVALSPIFWGWNWSASPPSTYFANPECSSSEPVTLYWEPTVPFGQYIAGYDENGNPIHYPYPGAGHNQGWNCSPQNPYFVGWQNLYNAIDAVLERAQSNSLIVSELNVQQELDLSAFTVLARFILDNKHGNAENNPDVFDSLRYYMGQRGFDWKRVTVSVKEERASSPEVECSNGTVYGDSGRLIQVSALYAALSGTDFGSPQGWDNPQYQQTGLVCGGTFEGAAAASLPYGHAFPNVLDLHSYPCLKLAPGNSHCDPGQSGETLKNEAKANFNAVKAFLDSYGPGGAHGYEPDVFGSQFLLGETHSNRFQTEAQAQGQFTCENWPAIGPWGTVRGFNESSLAGRTPASAVRPWNYPNHACYLLPSPLGPYLPPQ